MPGVCPHCLVSLERTRRQGLSERVLLGPIAFIRPFRCPECSYRRLRVTRPPSPMSVLLLLVTVLVGVILIQMLFYLGGHARNFTDPGYHPRDLERGRQLEREKPPER